MDLRNKIVLITGGAKRIGREIAKAFAAKGAHLALHYRCSKKEAESLRDETKAFGTKISFFQADLLKTSEVKNLAESVLQEMGAVDVLVNNASIFYHTPFEQVTEKDWDDFYAIHVKAPFFLAQALASSMKKKGSGRIINIADWSGRKPYKDYLPYCVSKGALMSLAEGLAKTLAPEVLVTTVCPGPILPPEDLSVDEKERIAHKTLVGRWGDPADIAKTVVFLAESDFITGSFHLVDGGESLGR